MGDAGASFAGDILILGVAETLDLKGGLTMTSDSTAIKLERATEQLRQEREVFDQRKQQESRWFFLRISMGYTSVILLFAVVMLSSMVIFNADKFPEFTVKAAGAALFVDVVGLLISVWKVVLNPNFMTKLAPETKEEVPKLE